MSILLQDIWPIDNLMDYKLHFARPVNHFQPLEVWARSPEEWQTWQESKPSRDDFNRPLIFSLMQFYHETDTWLFGGVFRVLERHEDRYKVELTDIGKEFIGRLKIGYSYKDRITRPKMESHFTSFEVKEVSNVPYVGRNFCGYDEIDISFEELEVLIRKDKLDWKTALENIAGVYLITDTNTGKRYVGSAYGNNGIWSRWSYYMETRDGGNKGLYELREEHGDAYCRSNFRFALLEHFARGKVTDSAVISRESFWKRVLMTRDEEQGLNRN